MCEIAGLEGFEIVAPHPLNLLCLRLKAGDAVVACSTCTTWFMYRMVQ